MMTRSKKNLFRFKWNHAHEIPPQFEIRQFTSIYLNLIQKALDLCVESQMGVKMARESSQHSLLNKKKLRALNEEMKMKTRVNTV